MRRGWAWSLLGLGACAQLLGVDDVKPRLGDDDAAIADARGDASPPDAVPPDASACTGNGKRCAGNDVQQCVGGSWTPVQTCDDVCSQGGCVTPPSCSGGVATCGVSQTATCCASLPVAGGTFARSYDGVTTGHTDDRYQATLSDFDLDRFEVSVARFQQFVNAYPASKPTVGTGKNPHDTADSGWQTAWDASLPATQADLSTSLHCGGISQSATEPVRCVSWYVAQAFCIWDGGRLPSEAEWNYAASGGSEQRVYPWSQPASSTTIDATRAVYAVAAALAPGSKSTAGDGRWGQADLAGNVWEWVLDYYADPYPTDSCDDCANHTAASFRVTRGGSYGNVESLLYGALRSNEAPTAPDPTIGFRCARDPQP